ncbi:MAG: hypothetical protein FJ125_13470, partial [Deltaproteobacteria bacterium]|nr:hypothetical protein [Deltaproteobacteria bacterium]
LGLMGIDYPVILESGGWNNHRGCFRLFGDWTAIAHPCRYGGLSTKPSPRGAGDEPPARTLRSLYGRFPAVEDLEKEEIKKLSPEQVADLLYWKVCEGQTLSPALARQVMASPSARLRETGLLLLAAAGQDPAARRESLKAVYEHPDQNTPQALALANLANEELGAGYGAQLLPLLKHPDLTVAITAAGALSKVGEKEQRVPFEQAVRELAESFDRDTAGKPKAAAVRAFMQPALDLATFRLEAPPLPKEAPTRVPDAKNTDLPRLMPADNNNVYDGAGLLRKWPEGGPRELWRQEIGDGYPAVIEAGGKAFAVGVFERKPHAYAFEAETGKPLWKKPLLGRKPGYLGASPVADDDRVYFSLDGAVVCLNASDGSEKWREEKAFGGATFATPLVVGDAIYVPGKSLAAADKLTGKLLWKTDGPAASPASPCYQMLDGVPQIVQAVGGGSEAALWGVSAKSGEVFWKTPIKIGYGLCSSPVAQGSRVLISSGVPGSEFFTALQMFVADGRIKALPAFTSREAQANYANTMAVWQGVVFGFGSGGLECAEAATGKRLWRQKDPGWTQEHQLIVADGLIFALSSESLVLLEASREGCRELARVKAPVKLAAQLQQPTLANGRLYLRGEKWIVCYAVK